MIRQQVRKKVPPIVWFVVNAVLGYLGIIFFFWLSVYNLSYLPVAARCFFSGVSLHDAIVFSDTRRSHFLLTDGRLQIDIGKSSTHSRHADYIARLFPDAKEHRQVLVWGRKLVNGCRAKHIAWLERQENFSNPEVFTHEDDLRMVERAKSLRELEITDDLAAHAAWRRLVSAPGAKANDLFKLKAIVREHLPEREQHQKLVEWTKFRRQQKEYRLSFDWSETEFLLRPAPPDLPWFSDWIIYEDWCISDEMNLARKEWIITLFGGSPANFGHDRYAALVDYGADLADERRSSTLGTLPADDERASVIAAIDRMSGIDPNDSENLNIIGGSLAERDVFIQTRMSYARTVVDNINEIDGLCYPSDDIYVSTLAATFGKEDAAVAGGINFAFEPYAISDSRNTETAPMKHPFQPPATTFGIPCGFVCGIPSILIVTFLVGRGARMLTVTVPGFFLGLKNNKTYQTLSKSMLSEEPYAIAALVLATFLGWMLFLVFPDSLAIVWTPGPFSVLAALLAAGVFSGFLWEGVKNLVAVIMIKMGKDPMELWLDDIVAFAVSVPIMLFFQNSFPSLMIGAAIGFISPWTIEKVRFLFAKNEVVMMEVVDPAEPSS